MFSRIKSLFYKIKYLYFLDRRVKIDKTAFIHHGVTFIIRENSSAIIEIDSGVYIGRYANIHTNSKIKIGQNSVLSDYVFLSTLAHGMDPSAGRILSQPDTDKGEIVLGDNVFLGFGSKVLPGIELGNWTIVGAGAVVTKSFPDGFVMIAGNPAKIIKRYDIDIGKWVTP
ncbi:acyltransferase [Enterobacter kobei]|uniref:acyltransferase n=1 Tax=Enterobacter kobei TaxID=208224 RepID=UPI002FD46DA2